jgi:hypothetical protein
MKIIQIFVLLLLSVSTASAEEKSILVFAVENDNSRQSAVSLIQKADYASMTVTISSDEKEPVDQFRELNLAKQTVAQEAGKYPHIKLHTGRVFLSTESKSSMMKVASYGSSSSAVVHLLYLITEKTDIFQAARELASLAKNMKAPGKASYRFSTIKLVVDNPEKYRSKLLQMIFEDLKQARLLAKKSGKVLITGLENPVLVRQADDTRAELYINYSVSMELPGEQ